METKQKTKQISSIESLLWVSTGFFSKKVRHKVSYFLPHAKRCYSVFCFALTWKSIYAKMERRYLKEIIKVVTTLVAIEIDLQVIIRTYGT